MGNFTSFVKNLAKQRNDILSSFTIGDLENPVTAQTISAKLEAVDNLTRQWFDFLLKTEFPKE